MGLVSIFCLLFRGFATNHREIVFKLSILVDTYPLYFVCCGTAGGLPWKEGRARIRKSRTRLEMNLGAPLGTESNGRGVKMLRLVSP